MTIFLDKKILIFDENPFMGGLLYSIVSGFNVGHLTICQTWADAKYYIKEIKFDCIFTDWSNSPEIELECLNYIRFSGRSNDPSTPVIIVTGHTALPNIVECRDSGCTEIVVKPISPAHVFDKLYAAIYNSREFIVLEKYTGPDRRRKTGDYRGYERRSDTSLDQNDIDRILAGKDA